MAAWSTNHRACKTTWTTMLALNQFEAAFPDAGAIRMQDCQFWAGSANALDTRARALAQTIDNVFRLLRKARYEEDVDAATAIAGLVDVLLQADATIAELAERADALYLFWQEGEE